MSEATKQQAGIQPQRGCGQLAQPFQGWNSFCLVTQGSRCASTLGWMPQPLRGWAGPEASTPDREALFFASAAKSLPSPWGEGQGEGDSGVFGSTSPTRQGPTVRQFLGSMTQPLRGWAMPKPPYRLVSDNTVSRTQSSSASSFRSSIRKSFRIFPHISASFRIIPHKILFFLAALSDAKRVTRDIPHGAGNPFFNPEPGTANPELMTDFPPRVRRDLIRFN